MSKQDELRINQQQLVEAWQKTLPSLIPETDSATVIADGADNKALRVTIEAAGHQLYSFDFRVEYVDSREIKVDFIDVEEAGRSVDEHQDTIQQLIDDYMRHIRECAQALHTVTHA